MKTSHHTWLAASGFVVGALQAAQQILLGIPSVAHTAIGVALAAALGLTVKTIAARSVPSSGHQYWTTETYTDAQSSVPPSFIDVVPGKSRWPTGPPYPGLPSLPAPAAGTPYTPSSLKAALERALATTLPTSSEKGVN